MDIICYVDVEIDAPAEAVRINHDGTMWMDSNFRWYEIGGTSQDITAYANAIEKVGGRVAAGYRARREMAAMVRHCEKCNAELPSQAGRGRPRKFCGEC